MEEMDRADLVREAIEELETLMVDLDDQVEHVAPSPDGSTAALLYVRSRIERTVERLRSGVES